MNSPKPFMLLRGMRADSEEAREAIRLGEAHCAARRKYTLMQLDEAAKIAFEVGPAESARVTGVNVESIKKHAQRIRRANGTLNKPRFEKYSAALKSKVIQDALRYRVHTKDSWEACFGRAAVNNGLDAKAAASIMNQYQKGTAE